jgi:hypothetical protein
MRGDRSPYVLADQPSEVIRLADDAMASRWSAAVRAALVAQAEPAKLAVLYAEWAEHGPPSLADLGAAGLHALERESRREGTRLRGTSRASDGAARIGVAE